MKVFVESDGQLLEYLNSEGEIKTVENISKAVTNFEYEQRLNEDKRTIKILNQNLVGLFLEDTKNIMKYTRSSQYIDDTNKKTYNSRNNR